MVSVSLVCVVTLSIGVVIAANAPEGQVEGGKFMNLLNTILEQDAQWDQSGNLITNSSVKKSRSVVDENGTAVVTVQNGNANVSGALAVTGDVETTNANVTGSLHAGDATITGDINSANLATGSVNATGGTFSGALSAGSVEATNANIDGTLTTENAKVNATLSTKDLSVTGDIGAINANLTGDIRAETATINGNFSAGGATLANATVNGDATITGDAYVGTDADPKSLYLKGALSALSADISGNFSANSLSAVAGLSIGLGGNQLIVDNLTGNVGIGTTLPTEKLDVLGNANVSGDTTVSGALSAGSASVSGDASVGGALAINNATVSGALVVANAPTESNQVPNRGYVDAEIDAATSEIATKLTDLSTQIDTTTAQINAKIDAIDCSSAGGGGTTIDETIVINGGDGVYFAEGSGKPGTSFCKKYSTSNGVVQSYSVNFYATCEKDSSGAVTKRCDWDTGICKSAAPADIFSTATRTGKFTGTPIRCSNPVATYDSNGNLATATCSSPPLITLNSVSTYVYGTLGNTNTTGAELFCKDFLGAESVYLASTVANSAVGPRAIASGSLWDLASVNSNYYVTSVTCSFPNGELYASAPYGSFSEAKGFRCNGISLGETGAYCSNPKVQVYADKDYDGINEIYWGNIYPITNTDVGGPFCKGNFGANAIAQGNTTSEIQGSTPAPAGCNGSFCDYESYIDGARPTWWSYTLVPYSRLTVSSVTGSKTYYYSYYSSIGCIIRLY